jgi:fatty-acyl-CoA synthase
MKKVMDRMNMEDVTICYGMTETSPVSTMTGPDDDVEHRTATVGAAMAHIEVRVADPETGKTLERGETGEFQTRGYSVMLGYWDEPEKTSEAIDAARWMHTGDQAVMLEDGYCKIVGRIKDMIIRGGENVYPREVEEYLYKHEAVADVQVVGLPDERYGEEVCACVILREGASVEPEELREFCKGSIAHYKVPRYVLIVDEMPMTVTGKIQKFKLRDQAVEQLGLSVPA